MSHYLAVWNDPDQQTLWPKFPRFISAYAVFKKAHLERYEQRLLGHADQRMTNAIGVCLYWLREHQAMSFSEFMDSLENDPLLIHRVRNLGPVRRRLVIEYFKAHPVTVE